ncbi:hypothetical protein [Ornithinimicrobium kibberense]|uniref:hypothetical protein n=1 Tax=Ornithinimicrobium kibberense TaxID=282060 RepID=UPI003622CA5E
MFRLRRRTTRTRRETSLGILVMVAVVRSRCARTRWWIVWSRASCTTGTGPMTGRAGRSMPTRSRRGAIRSGAGGPMGRSSGAPAG